MNPPFQLALVGIDHPHGAGWRELLLPLENELRVTAVVPRFDGALASLEERYADVPRYETIEQLLAQGEFDGALCCLPNDEGPRAMEQLVRAGKHVLAEKPAAASADAVRSLVAAVDETGVAFQTGYMWRYDPAVLRLRRMIQDGQFGHLISIEMTFVTSDVRRRGPDHYLFDPAVSQAGFFNWLACHYLDLLLYVTQRQVLAVTARCGTFGDVPVEVEDGGIVILELEKGAIATFIGGYWLPRWAGEAHWCVRGSQRWVHWDQTRPGTGGVLEIHGPKPQWHAMEELFQLPPDSTPGYGGRNGLAVLQDWLEMAHTGAPCRNSARSMLATLEVIDAIYASSREGRRVCLASPTT